MTEPLHVQLAGGRTLAAIGKRSVILSAPSPAVRLVIEGALAGRNERALRWALRRCARPAVKPMSFRGLAVRLGLYRNPLRGAPDLPMLARHVLSLGGGRGG